MADPEEHTASRRIHIHLFQAPVEIVADERGHVKALRTERTALNGDGTVSGTGVITTWPVQAVYRAVGYFSSPIPGLPFDERAGVVPNVEGRVIEGDTTKDESAPVIPGVYATGWIKRGPSASSAPPSPMLSRRSRTSWRMPRRGVCTRIPPRSVTRPWWPSWSPVASSSRPGKVGSCWTGVRAGLGEATASFRAVAGTRERVKACPVVR